MKAKNAIIASLLLALAGCGGANYSKPTPTPNKCTTGNCWTLTLTDSLQVTLVAYTIQAAASPNPSPGQWNNATVVAAKYFLPVADMCNWVTAWPSWTISFDGASYNGEYGGYSVGQTSMTGPQSTPGGYFTDATNTTGVYEVYNDSDLEQAPSCQGTFPAQDKGTFQLAQSPQ